MSFYGGDGWEQYYIDHNIRPPDVYEDPRDDEVDEEREANTEEETCLSSDENKTNPLTSLTPAGHPVERSAS